MLIFRKKGKKNKQTKEAANGHAENGSGNDELSKLLCSQSKLLWKTIDTLKKLDLKKPELVSILEENEQEVPSGIDKVVEN